VTPEAPLLAPSVWSDAVRRHPVTIAGASARAAGRLGSTGTAWWPSPRPRASLRWRRACSWSARARGRWAATLRLRRRERRSGSCFWTSTACFYPLANRLPGLKAQSETSRATTRNSRRDALRPCSGSCARRGPGWYGVLAASVRCRCVCRVRYAHAHPQNMRSTRARAALTPACPAISMLLPARQVLSSTWRCAGGAAAVLEEFRNFAAAQKSQQPQRCEQHATCNDLQSRSQDIDSASALTLFFPFTCCRAGQRLQPCPLDAVAQQ